MPSFYRVAKRFPPGDREYETRQERQGDPPADLPDEVKRSWDALSMFDSEEGARRAAERWPHLGRRIVRYDIPEGAGIAWEQSGLPGHYDVRGDKEVLKRCLADFVAEVRRPRE